MDRISVHSNQPGLGHIRWVGYGPKRNHWKYVSDAAFWGLLVSVILSIFGSYRPKN